MSSLWGQEVTLPHFSDSYLHVHSFNSIFFPSFFPASADLSSYLRAFNTCMKVGALSTHSWQRAVTLLVSSVVPLNETHETPESPRGSFFTFLVKRRKCSRSYISSLREIKSALPRQHDSNGPGKLFCSRDLIFLLLPTIIPFLPMLSVTVFTWLCPWVANAETASLHWLKSSWIISDGL